MLRAMSTRARSRRGYEKLGDESTLGLLEGRLKRARSVPSTLFDPSKKLGGTAVPVILEEPPRHQPTSTKSSHPIFSLFSRRKKKTTAKPEFSRYLEYLKEGGMWDHKSNMPVIYFK